MNADARLSVLADRLRALARTCPGCNGEGRVSIVFIAHRATSVGRGTPRIQVRGCGSASLVEPCLACLELRQLIDLAEYRE